MDATPSPPESASRLCYVTRDSDTPGRRSLEKSRDCRIDIGASFLFQLGNWSCARTNQKLPLVDQISRRAGTTSALAERQCLLI
jgi:hypothetical protein